MRIGVNGRFLVAKRTGVQRAAYNLLTTLVKIDRENEYLIFTGGEELDQPEWQYDNVKIVASHIRSGENIRNHLWEQFILPRLVKQYNIDILHSPANIAPLFYRGKSIIHIHDLCFVVNPQWYSFSFRTLYNLMIPRLAKKATKVITNSNNSRNDLMQFFGISADKVSLVYWAVDEIFLDQKNKGKQTKLQEDEDYILYVGSLEPRKNIKTLIDAYVLLRTRNPSIKTKLVLIGGESPLFADVRLKIKAFKSDVIFKGFVSDENLRTYYANASLVAYPSLYEGFGLPPLEAMASGTPVITSMSSSIPEVVGDAAIMISPFDSDQLAEGMRQILEDNDLRESLIQKGYVRARSFNWYRVARNVLAVYYEVFNSSIDSSKTQKLISYEEWDRLAKIESQMLLS